MPPAGGTTTTIRIILSSNAKDFGRDLGGAGDSGRRAGAGIGEAGDAAGRAGKNFVSLGGLVREAAASFAGFLSAQAVFQAISAGVSFMKDTILGFNSSMTESLAIMGQVSEGTKRSMELTARDVAVKYNAAVADVADTYYYLASAGYDAETSQKAVGQVVAFAKAGMFDLETATELAADAQNAMGLKSGDSAENLKQLTRITDVLTKANIDANGSVQDFAKALTNKAAAGARLAGVSLESTVAVLETFAAQGLKGKRAGEAFAIVLRDLMGKSQENAEAFENLGITVYDAQGNFAGFPLIISQLEKALAGMSVEQANATLNTLGFTMEAGAYVKTLLGMSGAIGEYETKLKAAGGATQQIAEKQMTSMIERLKHLRVLAAEAGLKGFDLLTQAVIFMGEKLAPGINAGADALVRLVEFARPAAEALLKIGGGAVVAGFLAFAKALELTTGFLRDHEVILQTLVAGGLTMLVGALASAVAGWVAFGSAYVSTFLLLTAYDLALWASSVYVAMSRAVVSSGLLGGAMTGLKAVMSTTAVQAGIFTAALLGILQAYQQSHEAADKWVESITQKVDPTNVRTITAAFKDLNAENDRLIKQIQGENWLGQYAAGMADLLIPIHDVEDSVYDLGVKSDAAQDKMAELRKQSEQATSTINAMARELSPAAQKLEESAGKFSLLNDQARQLAQHKAGVEISTIATQLSQLAVAANIDITKPVTEWKDELAKAWTMSQNTQPALLQLHQAFTTVADGASDAEDAVKAYETALNALIGIHISSKEAEIQFADALEGVKGKLGGGINLLDVYNAKNREAASAVLGTANAAIDHAVAVYNETGSLEKANGTLAIHREQLINSMVQTGMTRKAAEDYLNTLGLTPKNIETLAKLNKDQAQQGANELIGAMNEAARPRTGSIQIVIDGAMANLNSLESRMRYVQGLWNSNNGPGAMYALGRTLAAGNANGNVYRAFAGGGIMGAENHVAQVARAGTWRLWAEDETGGEAYIPLARGKRQRSLKLLDYVANMFGFELVKSFAQGGTYGLNDAAFELAAHVYGGGRLAEDLSWEGMSKAYEHWLSGETNGMSNRSLLIPEYGSSAVHRYDDPNSGWWDNGKIGARMQEILAPYYEQKNAETRAALFAISAARKSALEPRGRTPEQEALFAINDMWTSQRNGYMQTGIQAGAGGRGYHGGMFVGPGAVVVHANGAPANEVEAAVGRAFARWQKDMRREMRTRRLTSRAG